jgi:acyl carrier protein
MIQELNAIFRDIFDDPELNVVETTSSQDIPEWDSVAQVKLVLAIEEEFGVEFTTDEVAAFKCVGDFVRALEARRASD